MQRTGLALAALLLAALVLLGLAWWVGTRRSEETAAAPPARSWSVTDARRGLDARLAEIPPSSEGSEVVLTASDLRRLLIVSIAEHEETRKLLPAVKEVEAEVREEEARMGLSVDLTRIDELDLTDEQRQAAAAIEKLLLLLGQKEVFLGVRGVPEAHDGEIVFGPDSRVRVSALELSPASFAERFGIAREKVERGISLGLPGHSVERVVLEPGALRLFVVPFG
ncbi:MAG: hypothetical protein R3325_15380 [Thermoanaerobaculia bacterium]|nr:hypothetical protein [Thermoanaerobaculia bacterium]